MRDGSWSRVSILAAAGALALSPISQAANLYWDVNGATAGLGGTGTWDLSSNSWATASTGLGAVAPWTNTNPAHVAYFRAASSVTLNPDSQNIDLGGINSGGAAFTATVSGPSTGTAALNITGNAVGVTLGNFGSAGLNIAAPIVGTGGLSYSAQIGQFGSVTMSVTGVNTYSGDTTITNAGAGLLVFRAGPDSVLSGSTIVSGTFGKGTLKLSSNAQLTGGSGSGSTIIANPVSLDGNFRLGWTSSGFKGVRFDGAATLTGNRTITVDSSSGQPTFANAIGESAAGYGLTKSGTGTLTLQGTNSYTGGTTVTAGTLTISSGGSVGSGPLTVNNPNTGAGVNVVANLNSAQTVGSLSGTIATPSSGTNTATLNLTGVTTLLSVKQTTATTFGGVLAGTGGLILHNDSTGALSLTRPNTYSGGTTIESGKLSADNLSGSATGTAAVAVNAGGTLGGVGSVSGLVTVNADGRLSPGNSVGTLTAGSLTLGAGGILDFEFNSTANDKTAVTGALTIGTAGINLYEEGTTNPLNTQGTYDLLSYGTLSGLPTDLAVLNPQSGWIYTFSNNAGSKLVQLTVVPEPTIAGIVGVMSLCSLGRRRRV